MGEKNPFELDDFTFDLLRVFIKHGFGNMKLYETTCFQCQLCDETALMTLAEFYEKCIPSEFALWRKGNKTLTFSDWLAENWEKGNLCPPPLPAQEALKFLHDYLLEGWYSTMPMNTDQVNTEMVHMILQKHSKKYRKELKERQKNDKT